MYLDILLCLRLKGLVPEELLVYQCIEAAGNTGIIRHVQMSNISPVCSRPGCACVCLTPYYILLDHRLVDKGHETQNESTADTGHKDSKAAGISQAGEGNQASESAQQEILHAI